LLDTLFFFVSSRKQNLFSQDFKPSIERIIKHMIFMIIHKVYILLKLLKYYHTYYIQYI